MYVINRHGEHEPVHFDEITKRVREQLEGLDKRYVDPVTITLQVLQGFCSGITTEELTDWTASAAASYTTLHPDYAILGARLRLQNIYHSTSSFSNTMLTKLGSSVLHAEFLMFVEKNASLLDPLIETRFDQQLTYFGLKTLEKSYLQKNIETKAIVEQPQHMFLRVAVYLHGRTTQKEPFKYFEDLKNTYLFMAQGYFIHATPTLFSAGTLKQQLCSCFLLTMNEDSIPGIYSTLGECAVISQNAGGIGLAVQSIRCNGSPISSVPGATAVGLVPMLRVYNTTARYVDQGRRRPGAFAIYLEPWHADIEEWLKLRLNTGLEEDRARDLFQGLWMCDLFMMRVEKDADWSLFDPHVAPELAQLSGKAFEARYIELEQSGKAFEIIKAMKLWRQIVDTQIQTGMPYMLYKDACNFKSNQRHLGTIQSSNLCTEIIQFTSPEEIAVCNLGSLAVNRFARPNTNLNKEPTFSEVYESFDWILFKRCVKLLTRNLNRVIDINHYPLDKAKTSNLRHRPIGIGIQGLADLFMLLHLPWESDTARRLNFHLFEAIYYAALEASCELAQEYGVYDSYEGSPIANGQLQMDLWEESGSKPFFAYLLDWASLRKRIELYGVRNSLLVAPMPTASTSQILGNTEGIDPMTSNFYLRRVGAGEFTQVNQHLVRDLIQLNEWTEDSRQQIMLNKGSVQNLSCLNPHLKAVYKTVWEISQKASLLMAADRGRFIDQSQSLNIYLASPTFGKVSAMHFFGWKLGLKTGMYYLRTRPAANAVAFTLPASKIQETKKCDVVDENGACLMCQA